jgi:hypothetical protein
MSLEPVAWLCKRARNLPKDVKRQIAYYGRHATASLIKELRFAYGPYYSERKKLLLIWSVAGTWVAIWLAPGRGHDSIMGLMSKKFQIPPDYSELPAWVVEEVRSPDQQKNIF